ncbi:hypothetical protein QTP88_003969 [Uroleucon formosanum]
MKKDLISSTRNINVMAKRVRGGVVNTKIFYYRYALQQNGVKQSREDVIRGKVAIRGKRIRVLKRWGIRTGRINRLEDRSKILRKEGSQFHVRRSSFERNKEINAMQILFKLTINPRNPIFRCDSRTGVKTPGLSSILKPLFYFNLFHPFCDSLSKAQITVSPLLPVVHTETMILTTLSRNN